MSRTLATSVVRRWCRAGLAALERARDELDRTNVYPVADGDTGTNLYRTMESVVEALEAFESSSGSTAPSGPAADGSARHDGEVAVLRAAAHASLLGARGNSGVILSQLMRGVTESLDESLDGNGGRCDGPALARALTLAADLGYRAVGRPVEGTVLTVARAAALAASSAAEVDLAAVARAAVEGARTALAHTPDQLEVLRRAGVVDAGGHGLVLLLEALASVLAGEDTREQPLAPPPRVADPPPSRTVAPAPAYERDAQGPAYEVMYLLDADEGAVDRLRATLEGLGDSLVVVGGDGLWNVHVHVDDAGAALEAGMTAGRPHRVRVTSLVDGARRSPGVPRRVLCLAAGDGLASLLESAGARVLRTSPGRVPTTGVVLEAIQGSCAPEVVVLPDDDASWGVIEAAASRARAAGVRVAVLPTRATVQLLAALAVHDPQRDFDDDVVAMTAAAGATRFGGVTVATAEAVTSAGVCRPGDVLGLIEGDVAVIGSTVEDTARAVVTRLLSGGGEMVTLVGGAEADPSLVERLVAFLRADRPEVDAVVYEGGQPAYPLLLGVE